MTTLAETPVVLDRDRTPARPISPLTRVHIELRKLVDTRSASALLIITAGLVVTMLVVELVVSRGQTTLDTLISAATLPLVTLVPVLGILTTCGEWRHGTATSTYALDPRRTQVLLAKTVAVLLTALVFGAALLGLATLGCIVAGVDLPAAGAYATLAGNTLAGLLLLTLLGVALGSALLNTPAAIVVLLVLPQVLPQLLSLGETTARLVPWVDVHALAYGIMGGTWPTEPARALTTIGIWIVLPLALGVWRNATREA